ncbi:RNA-guided endonuclease InsQ/TnpB family protein [Streptomyces sp. RLB1-33]|nr:transposase [Streptomyces sp. RLB1-33]
MDTQVKRAFKYRFYPTHAQATELSRTFGCVRKVYNVALGARTEAWARQERVNYNATSSMLTAWKKTEELAYLNEDSSVPLQQALRHSPAAFTHFFGKRAKYPRFKSRKKSRKSGEYTTSAFRLRDGELRLAKMAEPLAIVWSRPLPEGASLSRVSVSQDAAGRWFVSMLCEDPSVQPLNAANAAVGIVADAGYGDAAAFRHGRNLRSGDPAGIEQEMWSLLTLYQALRTVMVGAAESLPGTDPDRCCFSITLHTARDQVIQANGIVTADTDRDTLLGMIGRRILTGLLPSRRQRVSTRKVKSPMSRYSERHADGRPDTSHTVTHLNVTVLEPLDHSPVLPSASRDDRHAAPAARRRHRILALLQEDPTRLWQPRDIAAHFGDVTLETMYRQLNRWAASGLIHKLGPGLYAATPWSPASLA